MTSLLLRCATTLTLLLVSTLTVASAQPQFFHLQDVRLLESPFLHAQERDIEYLFRLEPDALLAPFLREAGLKPKRAAYGNWESQGLDGHIGGHYLSALSMAYASTNDLRLKARLSYFVEELARAQQAYGNGYVGGIPGSRGLWREIERGDIRAQHFSLNDKWVPLYNLHKTMAGLRDAYLVGGNTQALTVLKNLMAWLKQLASTMSDEQIQQLLISEHGGINEVLADYAQMSGDESYLSLARRFSDRSLLQPLSRRVDKLDGLHANTQIPKVVGFARIAQLSDDSPWLQASEFFWQTVALERSVAIGGNSESEHFHAKNDFSSMLESVQGPETCNTYNMLKLSALLYQQRVDRRYVEYYERALYNHILASQHPDTGGLVYFTPMRPQHYRTYSQVDTSMWCCVGSGIENHVNYGKFIYAHQDETLWVNLYLPSRVHWREKGVVLRQQNRIPDRESSHITIETGGQFTLKLREPTWLASAMQIRLNGELLSATTQAGYVSIERDWQAGDVLAISLPMRTRAEALPDGSPHYALLHGPVVLAAKVERPKESLSFFADDSRMGHVASGALCPLNEAPMFVSNSPDIVQYIKRIPGERLRFSVEKALRNSEHVGELIPFFRLHESRYMLYWRHTDPQGLKSLQAEQQAAEQQRLQLQARTVDVVFPGQQQSEVEHDFRGGETESGLHRGRHWRHGRDWFSYTLDNRARRARRLQLTLNGDDDNRVYDVLVNDTLLATITADGSAGPVFVQREFLLPPVLREQSELTVTFRAHDKSMAGGIFELRLLNE